MPSGSDKPQRESPAKPMPEPDQPNEPQPEPIPPEEANWEGEGGAVLPPGIALTLRGPDGADLEAALEAARAALPEGYRLERD